MQTPTRTLTTRCCVVGGGPAGLMAGLLLARQGVDVTVLEKHGDFLRDFRGDTVHPSTLQVLDELGLIEEFLRIRHSEVRTLSVETPAGSLELADFSRLPGKYRYIAFMPQWDLLDFLARKARELPSFRLVLTAEATDLVRADGRVLGVLARTADGPLEVHSDLVLAADGRHSAVRRAAGLPLSVSEAPMDVLWFRLSREPGETMGFLRTGPGHLLITIDRGDYWQTAFVIPSGGYATVRAEGLARLRERIASVRGAFADRLEREITDWDDLKLLNVRVDRLRTWWRPGLLCIGDAAHAMSPAGGVGINLAVQDAVAAARMLGPTLRAGRTPAARQLAAVQRRRSLPVRAVQLVQVRLMRDLYPTGAGTGTGTGTGVGTGTGTGTGTEMGAAAGAETGTGMEPGTYGRPPLAFRAVRRFPFLRHWTARFIGLGLRPEHVD
ncbi:FAD-dependent oxidoreductase [Streptomyces sp. NPDC093252]|uniref:FAD-dependent oxidoreductase n=1 Tax=Streptomyces sp. NPDC093252 TaxID=3154980 RepID=UPI00341DFC50